MEDRDKRILRHVGLHRLSLRPVIASLFFAGENPGNVIQRLRAERLLCERKGLPRNRSYYQLTPAAVARLGLPRSRANKPRSQQALLTYLGLLWFCCMGSTRRLLLEPAGLKELLGENTPPWPHCLEAAEGASCIYAVYVPGPDTSNRSVFRQLRDRLLAAKTFAAVRPHIASGMYRFAVLVEHEVRATALQRMLERQGLGDDARFHFGRVPTAATLTQAVAALRGPRTPQDQPLEECS